MREGTGTMQLFERSSFPLIFGITILLTACGGGGGSDNPQPNTVTYAVTTIAGDNGSIDPSFTLNEGETPRVNITPDPGYIVDVISGCNGDHVSPFLYEIGGTGDVTADCTVTVSFTPGYIVTTVATGLAGSIFPAKIAVRPGGNALFSVIPGEGTDYGLSGCNDSYDANGNDVFTTVLITGDCTCLL
mgnify:CR=1 FL=1